MSEHWITYRFTSGQDANAIGIHVLIAATLPSLRPNEFTGIGSILILETMILLHYPPEEDPAALEGSGTEVLTV